MSKQNVILTGVNMLSFAKKCFAFVVCLNFSVSSKTTEIKLNLLSECSDAAELGWTVFTTQDPYTPLTNCSLVSKYDSLTKPILHHLFRKLSQQGVYRLESKLFAGGQYSFQIDCGNVVSNAVVLTALDNCTQAVNKSRDPDVVYQKQTGLFDGSQDTVLGVVIGLFGLSIIVVTSYYLWRRYRNRQRRQRIRSYLGASLIDPFTNMQNRMDEIETSGGQRLMGSTESL